MKSSARRVGNTLVVLGLIALTVSTLHQVVGFCGAGQDSCLLAAVTFGLPEYQPTYPQLTVDTALSTTQTMENGGGLITAMVSFTQAFSVYLLLVGVMIIAVLELLELKYLRQLAGLKRV
jgi:hypothetical protein